MSNKPIDMETLWGEPVNPVDFIPPITVPAQEGDSNKTQRASQVEELPGGSAKILRSIYETGTFCGGLFLPLYC